MCDWCVCADTKADCNWNGECKDGACICTLGLSGADCSTSVEEWKQSERIQVIISIDILFVFVDESIMLLLDIMCTNWSRCIAKCESDRRTVIMSESMDVSYRKQNARQHTSRSDGIDVTRIFGHPMPRRYGVMDPAESYPSPSVVISQNRRRVKLLSASMKRCSAS